MSKNYNDRREVSQGDFAFLVDDEDRTAWISEGNSGSREVYTLPEQVVIDGMNYLITSVEIGAFNTCKDKGLKELFVPNCYEYLDEESFNGSPIERLHLGKGLKHYMFWFMKSAVANVEIIIDPQNPYIKMSDDGHMVLSKDGTQLIYLVHDIEEVFVPEGVEVIHSYAISCMKNLQKLHLPESLIEVQQDGIFQCPLLQ